MIDHQNYVVPNWMEKPISLKRVKVVIRFIVYD